MPLPSTLCTSRISGRLHRFCLITTATTTLTSSYDTTSPASHNIIDDMLWALSLALKASTTTCIL
eukprot:1525958-Amphidinium_carterae.5